MSSHDEDRGRVLLGDAPHVELAVVGAGDLASGPQDGLELIESTFGNEGTDTATNGMLEDAIPPNSTFVSATDGGVFAGGIVSWPVPVLPVGTTASVGLTVRVNDTVSDGDLVTNALPRRQP